MSWLPAFALRATADKKAGPDNHRYLTVEPEKK
jgi:hypothetical protein